MFAYFSRGAVAFSGKSFNLKKIYNYSDKSSFKGTVMIKKNHKRIFSLLICALLAPHMLSGYTQVNNNIELKVHDCAANPGQALVYATNPITAGQFLQKGIHPVRLKITNKSDAPIIISSKSVFKEQVDPYQAARMFHLNNQFTSSLFLDACLLTTGVNVFAWGPAIPFSFIAAFLPGSAVGTTYWFYVRSKNGQLTQDFNRALTENYKNNECIIQPESSVTKIVLLRKEYKIPRFTFRVFDEQNKQAVASFEVTLDS